MSAIKALLKGLLLWGALVMPALTADLLDDERVLREFKQVLWPKAYREQDVALLDRILADNFRLIDDQGRWSSKAEELQWVAANKPGYDSLSFAIERLEIFGGDTAIVAGTGTLRGSNKDGPYIGEYRSTNVLIKQNGVWRAVASHISGYQEK
jgi:ketosteroid isomerase-like protein